MSVSQNNLFNPDSIIQTLQQRCFKQQLDIFDNSEPLEYWRLSDLANLYPNIFNVQRPITPSDIFKINNTIKNSVPEFKNLSRIPVHVLDVRETYNILLPETNTIQTVKNSSNQYLTRVACEYLFSKETGYTLQQAYFMYPNTNTNELLLSAENIRLERLRGLIKNTNGSLSSIIRRAYDFKTDSFGHVWSALWRSFYGTQDMSVKDRYTLKSSPINYMDSNTLAYTIALLTDIINHFICSQHYSISDIVNVIHVKGFRARIDFKAIYGKNPEDLLKDKDSSKTISKVQQDRINFWNQYYPSSLKQR